MNEQNDQISGRIRHLLRIMALSQGEFAEAGGIKRTTLVNWLSGKGAPTQPVLEAWIRKYNLNGHWLVTGEGELYQGISPSGPRTPFERDLLVFEKKMKELNASDEEMRQGILALAMARGKSS